MMSPSDAQATKELAEQDPKALIGTTVGGRYRVRSLLGKGGMGAVYLVEHLQIRKSMALKVLSPKMMSNPAVVARFEREATAAAHFDHPNVVSASDYGRTEDGRYYLVLEYVEGKELRDVLDDAGALPPVRAFYIARQIAGALARAHTLGIVHRDLKPENIMLEKRDGQDDSVKVLDFGLALLSRHLQSAGGEENTVETAPKITKAGEIFGTPAYMAPEQTVGAATDIRTDLYALGVILYEMLTGLRPFEGKTLALIQQHLAAPPPPMKQRAPRVKVAEDMEALVQRLLAKQPADRYQTPAELITAIDQVAAAHNLLWPGRSSPSMPVVPRRPSSGTGWRALARPFGRAYSGLSRGLSWGREKIFPRPKPRGRLLTALQLVKKKLDWRKPKRRVPSWALISGAVFLIALLGGVLFYASRESAPEAEPSAPPRALPSAPPSAPASLKEAPRSKAHRGSR
jgi:serine/threonine protein kinase